MTKKFTNRITRANASKLHKQVFAILDEIFPLYTIEQEKHVEVYDEKEARHSLFLDFFIKELDVAIECQGKQHFEQNDHFHADSAAFKAQQHRDYIKKVWCEMNDITLIEIRYDEKPSKELIMKKIEEAL